MRNFFYIFLLLPILTSCVRAQTGNAMFLSEKGETAYVIALANDAIPAEKTAADQLQKYLQEVTGAQFPIQSEAQVKADVPQILVGAGERTKVLLPKQDWKALGTDGIVIKTVGKNLILAGGRPRGTLYAVFQFLQDEVGCRWWTPTESTIPQKSTLNVSQQNVVYVSPFDYREHFTTSVQESPEFATIMRQNGAFQRQKTEWGGHYRILGFVHTFSKLLPPEKYFQDHPEWYSDPENGGKPCTAASKMPAPQNTQLNLSAPGVLDELTKQALLLIDKNPDAGYISISQNDGDNHSKDAASMKLAKEEGSYAAPVLDFVNKVAAKIHQKYPDIKVETLAYVFTEKAPKTIRPAKNVVIRLAPIDADFGHPIDSEWNKEARDNLLSWAKIAPDLFVWNYVTNFRHLVLPHPNWLGLGPDLRFFAANNVKGIFEQGDSYTNNVGDFVQLRAWVTAQLMWNPDLDQEKLTDEFLQGYYGEAAPYLRQYLDLIQSAFLAQERSLSTYNADFSFLDLDTINRAIQLFEKAQGAVKGKADLSERVSRERLSLEAGVLTRYHFLKRTAMLENKDFLGPKDPREALESFIETAQKFGIKDWRAGGSFKSRISQLREMFADPTPLPEFATKFPEENVLDIQENFFHLFRSGTVTNVVKDAEASNGKAVSIDGASKEWAVQADLSKFLGAPPFGWHAYAMVRVETKADAPTTGSAFQSGVYDVTNRKNLNQVTIPIEQVAGSTYQRIDLGMHQLNGGMYIWFAPTQNPGVDKVYVDRIILIREN